MSALTFVIPADAGNQTEVAAVRNVYWVPAFAGMTKKD